MKRISIFLVMVALIASIVGCDGVESYTLTITSTAGGSVTTPGEGTFTYNATTVVNLMAEAEEGYYFVRWTGDVDTMSDTNAIEPSIAMNGHYSITANFVPDSVEPIRDWYDLDALRNNMDGDYILMNDLDSTTAGYEELAGPNANEGKGWVPMGTWNATVDGQGYEIRDFFIYYIPGAVWPLGDALFAFVDSGGTINNLGVRNAHVTGGNMTGGLVGNNRGTVSKCYSSGSVTIYGYGACIGGLVGFNHNGTVSNSYSTGSVTGNGGVGGLVGENNGGTVSNSYSTGSVTGNVGVGGLVGGNLEGTVSNSYATGTVTRSSGESTYFGGFVGANLEGKILNCYSTGNVHYEGAADPTDKGFAGKVDTGGDYEMAGNFWDTETSGQTSTAGNATGKTTTEMQYITTFSGWNITTVANPSIRNTSYIWNIATTPPTYPFLSWQPIL